MALLGGGAEEAVAVTSLVTCDRTRAPCFRPSISTLQAIYCVVLISEDSSQLCIGLGLKDDQRLGAFPIGISKFGLLQ